MNAKKIIAIILAVLVVSANIFFVSKNVTSFKEDFFKEFNKSSDKSLEKVLEDGDMDNEIAVLNINDVIASGDRHDYFMDSLEKIRNSQSIKAVVIKLNTPGGGVYESAQIYEKIKQIKKEKNIPFYAVMQNMAASGGYYVAASCDKIYAKPETLTGSIGVIMSSMNYSGLMQRYGVTSEVIKSGKFKDIGSPSRQMTPEDRAIFQNLINNSYEAFVKVVAEGRKMPISEVKKIADGRIYDGRQALNLKLIDKFGYYEDLIIDIKKDLNVQNPQIISYDYDDTLDNLFSIFGSASSNIGKSEIQKNIDSIKQLQMNNQNKPMYLYGGM